MTDKNGVIGRVVEKLPSLTFAVELEYPAEKIIRAKMAGKMIQNRITVVVGDGVRVVLSPDGEIGRIIRRL